MTGSWAEKWQGALCAEIGGDLWLPEKTESHHAAAAKKICASCPIAEQCLEYALEHELTRDHTGIWAGTNGRTRQRILARRKRAAA